MPEQIVSQGDGSGQGFTGGSGTVLWQFGSCGEDVIGFGDEAFQCGQLGTFGCHTHKIDA